MGTSDYQDREELDFRDYRRVRKMEAAYVRRLLFWGRVKTWAIVTAIIVLPCALVVWLVWEYS